MKAKWKVALEKTILRWKKIVENGGEMFCGVERCALCVVECKCANCPLNYGEKLGCSPGSPYDAWSAAHSLPRAKAVLAALEDCRVPSKKGVDKPRNSP